MARRSGRAGTVVLRCAAISCFALALHLRHAPGRVAQTVGIEHAGEQVVDSDVVAASSRAGPAMKAVRPARAPEERSSPRIGIFTESEVMFDDAAEALLAHRRDDALDEFDRRHHVLDDAGEHGVAIELAEILDRRPAIVVHQDVGLGAGGEKASWPSLSAETSAATAVTLAPVAVDDLIARGVEKPFRRGH